ncbi:globin domain-containing protein [Streptacidiphilus jiangxiensis]|uniref:globin domain-containing protein n=1 Tax=Streptacidiphilus jiangxiensis TaxID=235985 RepID=UPI0009DDBCAB|nr:globin domain-containing protein [Streptacidiphilus jiangxiensis]
MPEVPGTPPLAVDALGPSEGQPPEPAQSGYAPMIANAPALNWVGPDDAWSRAWAAPAAAVHPSAPLPIEAAPPPMPQGIPVAPLPPPPLPLPGSVVAVVPLAARQKAAAARQAVGPASADGAADTGSVGPTPQDIVLIRRSLAVVEPVADRATAHFYAGLFLARPELRALFPAAMDVQRDRLFRALLAAGRAADDPPTLVDYLEKLARGHRRYGVRDEHYAPVGAALLAALERYCGREWSEDTARAWEKVYGVISQVMMAAAARDAQSSPAWWQGEVQSVEPVTRDIAVVTLRTDHHYPYRAGQYASIEVPWWPRVWRNYSLACPAAAPSRPGVDGLLRMHVKAVPAGWVSNALVHRAQPGDVVRLGPAQGRMVVDPRETDPLLLVGGGTGVAPLLAIVEELALSGARRTVEVHYGARRAEELYAWPALQELDRRLPWLSIRTAVAEPTPGTTPPAGAERGTLPEVIGHSGPWEGYRACLSGPSAMIRRTRGVLLGAGVRAEHMLYDLEDGQS